jgi:hypothetical protein
MTGVDEGAVLSDVAGAEDLGTDDPTSADIARSTAEAGTRTTTNGGDTTGSEPGAGSDAAGPGAREGDGVDRRTRWLAYGSVLVPFVVLAVVLIVVARDHLAVADHAGMEAQTRNVGRHEVLVGLWSRSFWNHPGPMFYYLAAPLYWLMGGATIGLDLTAVAVNGACVAGMGLVAWRRGGTPLLLCTLLGCAFVMRSLGSEFLHDPWNAYIPTLPYGLLVLLVWSALCGDRWALPLAAVVATFAAQTHIGFMVLALPLVAVAGGWIVLRAVRTTGGSRRDVVRSLSATGGLLTLLWLPPLLDVLFHKGSNARRVVDWFQDPDEPGRSLVEGWRVMLGQFELRPEWLVGRRAPLFGNGESPFFYRIGWPLLLVPVVLAAVALWRRGAPAARQLVVTLALAFLLGVVGVWRTVGIGYQYRLWWTWFPAVLAMVMAAWAGWQEVVRRWPWAQRRLLVPGSLAVLGVLAVVNTTSALDADGVDGTDSDLLADLVDDDLGDTLGDLDAGAIVYVDGDGFGGIHYARGVRLVIAKEGFDVRMPEGHWFLREFPILEDGEDPAIRLVVATDAEIEELEGEPGYRKVAEAGTMRSDAPGDGDPRVAEIEAELRAGEITAEEAFEEVDALHLDPGGGPVCGSFACQVAIFEDTSPTV